MRLYGDRGWSNTRRVLTVIDHPTLNVEFGFVNLFVEENREREYLAPNPSGTIQTFADGTLTLFEASAIMIYLAEKAASTLWPSGLVRFEVLKWMFWAAEHFRRGPSVLIDERFIHRLKGQPEDPALVADAMKSIHRYSAVLDRHLQDREFVVGETPTLADIDLASPFSHIARTHAPFEAYPNLSAWHARLSEAVPAWRSSGAELERRIAEIEASFEGGDVARRGVAPLAAAQA